MYEVDMSTFTIVPITKTNTNNTDTLLQAVIQYREIQAKLAYLQNELKAPRQVIENAVLAAPELKIITPEYKITMSEVNRENFDKKAALVALGREVLAPYISTTSFFQLRVT